MFFTLIKQKFQWIKEALTRFGQKTSARFQRTK